MFERLIELTDSFLELGTPGYDLTVCQSGETLLRLQRGFSDLENRLPMNGSERFNIYSCSKPITCTAAMQLWEKGLFSLEDKLADYMPEFGDMTVGVGEDIAKAEKPILIRNLFEMTAGFTYDFYSPQLLRAREETDGRCPTREVMKYLAKEPLAFEPGAQWRYSLCHEVLAALVEVISGKSFGLYVKENIFEPLGMKNSTFLLPDEELPTVAAQYAYDTLTGQPRFIGPRIRNCKMGSQFESGGGGCVSTAEDYVLFLEALRKGDRIIKKETVALMATDRLSEQQHATYISPLRGYGLGLRCPRMGNDNGFSEFGWGGAAGAYLSVDPTRDLTIFYVQHVMDSPVRKLRSKIYKCTVDELDG